MCPLIILALAASYTINEQLNFMRGKAPGQIEMYEPYWFLVGNQGIEYMGQYEHNIPLARTTKKRVIVIFMPAGPLYVILEEDAEAHKYVLRCKPRSLMES